MEQNGFINNELENYLIDHTSKEDDVLYELNRFTNLTTVHPRMISGPIQGKFLELVCKMLDPQFVLEIGTFTGYSTICMAKGLSSKGHIHTIEINDEICEVSKKYFTKAGVENRITQHIADAIELIPTLQYKFDLVLIDGDKREYPQYLMKVFPKVNIGGIILADNVLWGGKAFDKQSADPYTLGVKTFNRLVADDNRMEQTLLPLRDGLMIIRKLAD